MRIRIITLGKLKESYWKDAEREYQKRLRPYCKTEFVELTPVKLPDHPSAAQIAAALDKEAEDILQKVGSALTIALCVEGKQLSSEDFAAKLLGAGGDVCLVIGSSYGLSERVKAAAHLRLSLSKMTLPHQLARVMLDEQLYRAITIHKNKKYHK